MKILQDKSRQFLALSVLGSDRLDTARQLTRSISDAGCNLLESRMMHLATAFSMQMLVSGSWDSVARLEQALPKMERELGVRCLATRTERQMNEIDRVPYAVDAVCLDQPGVVAAMIDFFNGGDIHVEELTTRTYPALHTGAPMLSVQLVVSIPSEMHIGMLRENFTDFCDRCNLDAVLEPIKS
ncbi:MAG: ACT domain-containing protein [Gammaproteobacteria bacterium]|nr:ACT domain-containing protein [Gammaproteobacteria bacterium]